MYFSNEHKLKKVLSAGNVWQCFISGHSRQMVHQTMPQMPPYFGCCHLYKMPLLPAQGSENKTFTPSATKMGLQLQSHTTRTGCTLLFSVISVQLQPQVSQNK